MPSTGRRQQHDPTDVAHNTKAAAQQLEDVEETEDGGEDEEQDEHEGGEADAEREGANVRRAESGRTTSATRAQGGIGRKGCRRGIRVNTKEAIPNKKRATQ